MPRTTLDIDTPILEEIRAIQRKDGRSMGNIVSQLLSEALAGRNSPGERPRLEWLARPMTALVDLSDKEAVYAALDHGER
jgi:hypothetical protein